MYFKIAWRTLIRNKAVSVINIGGLAVGMAVAILIGLWINDELSFNTYHENYNSIGRVMRMETWHNETGAGHSQTLPLGITLRNEYKKDFKYVVMATWPNDNIVAAGDKKFTQSGSYMQAEAP